MKPRIAIMFVAALAAAQAQTITTNTGTGGVSGQVQQDGPGTFGGGNWHVKNASTATTRKGYVRFDVSGISGEVASASLDLVVSTIQLEIGDTDQVINVYGLTDESLDSWDPSTTTWSNAPGNNTSSKFAADLTKATLLGTIVLDFNGDKAAPVGTVVSMDNAALVSFLNSDTNDLVTFILGRTVNPHDDKNLLFAGDTNATHDPPTLNYTLVPTATKADNTDNLDLGSSWVGATVPVSGVAAIWDSTVTSANSTVLGSDQTWGKISILNPNGPVTIGSGNTLTLDGAGTVVDLGNATTDLTVDADLAMEGDGVWDIGTGRTATAGGVISGSSGVTKQGDGVVVLSGANTYEGNTVVTAGTVQLGASEVIPNGIGTGNVTVNGTLDLNGNSDTINGLSGGGSVDNSADGMTSTLIAGDFGQSSTFNGVLQNSGVSAILNLEKKGVGNLVLGGAGANSYDGTTTISGGSLELRKPGALGNTSGILLGDGTTLVPDLDGLAIVAPITLGAAGTNATINAPTSGTSGGQVQTLTLNGAISGDGDLTINGSVGNNSYGTVVLGAVNTYTGATVIDCSAGGATCWVENGAENALPTTTVLTLDGGGGGGTGRTVQYDLKGFNQTLAGLTNVPGLSLRRQWVNSTGSAATLTINNTDDYSFGGSVTTSSTVTSEIRGAISLVKSGLGTFTLVGAHPYSGTTTVSGGRLQGVVGGNIASSAVTLEAPGTYGVSITDNTQSWTCDSLTTTGAGTLEFDFGSVIPSVSVSPLTITGTSGAADFSAATPLVSVLVDAGLSVGTYPLATWDSLVGAAPTGTELTVSSLAPGTTADLTVTGNTLELVITDTSVVVAKDGNAFDLNLGTSWSGGTAPAAGDTAVWNNTVGGANTTSLGADLSWGAISILDPGGPVVINAGNTLTLTGEPTGTLPLIDLSAATDDLTIHADLVLEDVGLMDVAASRTLTLGGVVSGSFGITKLGGGALVLSGSNSYLGTTVIDEGLLNITAPQALSGGLTFGATPGSTATAALDLSTASASFAGEALVQTNNAVANTISIGATQTLALNGGLTLGYDAGGGSGATESNLTVSGAGSLAITGSTIQISVNQAGVNQGYWSDPTLDVSGLGAFSTDVTGFNIGVGTTTQGPGTVLLSDTANTILATTLTVGNTGGNNGRGSGLLVLGTGTNAIQADTITIGRSKSVPGGATGMVRFASQADGSPGTVTIADRAGSGRANIDIANQAATSTGGGATGTLDLRGHVSTVLAEAVSIGSVSAASNTGGPDGTLSFDAGTFDVNVLTMATKTGGSTGTARGTLNVGGGSFIVNTAFTLGSQAGNGASEATVNLTGGTCTSNTDIINGGGTTTSTIALDGGTLDMVGNAIGSLAAPIVLSAGSGTLLNVGSINGSGGLTKTTTGTLTLTGTNTYTGDTVVSAGTLNLAGGSHASAITVNGFASLGFTLGSATTSTAAVTFDADSTVKINGIPTLPSYTLMTASSFAGIAPVLDAPISGYALMVDGTELKLVGAAGYSSWAAANAGGQGPDLDFDDDGVPNGVEFFMNAAAGFTANPQLDGTNTITWPNGGNIAASEYGTQFVIQTSSDLASWTDVLIGELTINTDGPGGSLTYTLAGGAPRFVRLSVTPN